MAENERPYVGVCRHLSPHAGPGVKRSAESADVLGHRDVHDQDVCARCKLAEGRVRTVLVAAECNADVADVDPVADRRHDAVGNANTAHADRPICKYLGWLATGHVDRHGFQSLAIGNRPEHAFPTE